MAEVSGGMIENARAIAEPDEFLSRIVAASAAISQDDTKLYQKSFPFVCQDQSYL